MRDLQKVKVVFYPVIKGNPMLESRAEILMNGVFALTKPQKVKKCEIISILDYFPLHLLDSADVSGSQKYLSN